MTTAISCDQALKIAHLDAERAYRDLSLFRIEITLEQDGWHIDHEIKHEDWNGGGPHYVFDAKTGNLIFKTYEQ